MNDAEIAAWLFTQFGDAGGADAGLERLMEGGFWHIVDWRLRLALVAFAADVGRPTCVRLLQIVLNQRPTGVVDLQVVNGVNGLEVVALRERVLAAQLRYYAEPRTDGGRRMLRLAAVLEVC